MAGGPGGFRASLFGPSGGGEGGSAGGLGALAVSAVGLCIVRWAGFRVASGWAGALGVGCGWMVGCGCMDFVTTGFFSFFFSCVGTKPPLRTRKWLRIFLEL